MKHVPDFPYALGPARIALSFSDYYSWDSSVIEVDGRYHLFTSRWPYSPKLLFGANWLFNSEIIHSVSDSPLGPYHFQNVVLPRRGRQYFDGMNTHNACIKSYGGKYYLYYMGCTYGGPGLDEEHDVSDQYFLETWNRKRIGLAVADSIDGPFIRQDKPLLEPRDCSHWDCTITTNPTVAILPDGQTYMIYKSRTACNMPLQLGVAYAKRPEGPFTRLTEEPLFQRPDGTPYGMEDPYFWYDAKRKKFCLIAKDDAHGGPSITGYWGGGFYAESDDAIHFSLPEHPLIYTRDIVWEDGHRSTQGNLERPTVLFGKEGNPAYLFFASGASELAYSYEKPTFVLACPLVPKGEEKQ